MCCIKCFLFFQFDVPVFSSFLSVVVPFPRLISSGSLYRNVHKTANDINSTIYWMMVLVKLIKSVFSREKARERESAELNCCTKCAWSWKPDDTLKSMSPFFRESDAAKLEYVRIQFLFFSVCCVDTMKGLFCIFRSFFCLRTDEHWSTIFSAHKLEFN